MVRFHVLSTRIPATTASDLNISSSVWPPLEDRHVCLDRSQLGQSVRELPDIPILPCEALISRLALARWQTFAPYESHVLQLVCGGVFRRMLFLDMCGGGFVEMAVGELGISSGADMWGKSPMRRWLIPGLGEEQGGCTWVADL